jgi:hypothetical protein
MTEFAGALSKNSSKIHALNNVRRAALKGPRGVRHPFSWTAFSIQLGRI